MAKDQIPSEKEQERLKIDLGAPQVGDIFAKINAGQADKAKRRVNTHGRMKRSQNEVGEILQEVFGETFHQTPGSGSYSTYNKGKMDPAEARAMTADVRVRNMKYILEVKSGYEKVLLEDLLIPDDEKGGKSSKDEIRDWLKEVKGYEQMSNTPALIFWKKPRRPFMVIAAEHVYRDFVEILDPVTMREFPCLRFAGWCIFDVRYLLRLPKEALFVVTEPPPA